MVGIFEYSFGLKLKAVAKNEETAKVELFNRYEHKDNYSYSVNPVEDYWKEIGSKYYKIQPIEYWSSNDTIEKHKRTYREDLDEILEKDFIGKNKYIAYRYIIENYSDIVLSVENYLNYTIIRYKSKCYPFVGKIFRIKIVYENDLIKEIKRIR